MLFLMALCLQTSLIFSMQNSVDLYMQLHEIPTPEFNAAGMIAFFGSESLKNFAVKTDKATKNLVENLTKDENALDSENTARIMQALIYANNITFLVKNVLIISVLKHSLIPLPKEYIETEKDFKLFWYALWKQIIPKKYTQQSEILIEPLLRNLTKRRNSFLNTFDYCNGFLDRMCEDLNKKADIIKEYENEFDPESTFFVLYSKMSKTLKDRASTLKAISEKMKKLIDSDIPLRKGMYLRVNRITQTKRYNDFGNFHEQWKNFWVTPSFEKKTEALNLLDTECAKYTVFLESYLKQANAMWF
jgi:hypothetical protein